MLPCPRSYPAHTKTAVGSVIGARKKDPLSGFQGSPYCQYSLHSHEMAVMRQ